MSTQSTGPRTSAGKAVSRFNPLRHGLTSQHLIIPGENPEHFHALHEDLRIAWAPDNTDEENLVAKIAEGEWRMLRARRVETATLKMYMERVLAETPADQTQDHDLALAQVYERYGKELDRLRRYETTISRALAKAQRELETLIAARQNSHPEDVAFEAELTRMETKVQRMKQEDQEFVSQNACKPPAVITTHQFNAAEPVSAVRPSAG